jgi:negative regulator of sigma E activity
MNCEKCQNLLSDFLDGTISHEDRLALNLHLAACVACAQVHEDLSAILNFCIEHRGEYVSPPNPQALWLRISNTIESENRTGWVSARSLSEPRESLWQRLAKKRWEVSLPQLMTAVAGLVVCVSLATAIGLQRLRRAETNPPPGPPRTVKRLNPQQESAIEYWTQRVAQRRDRWSPQMRAAFDRNMVVIDQTLNDALKELDQNPHDEISEEMLNAAFKDKMELLKEFSDL